MKGPATVPPGSRRAASSVRPADRMSGDKLLRLQDFPDLRFAAVALALSPPVARG
jgi:hypothetical protein